MSEEERKALAELKKKLEDKISSLQEEIAVLREATTLIDEKLAEVSFQKATEIAEAKALVEGEKVPSKPVEILNILYKGKNYGKVNVTGEIIAIEPDETLGLTTSVRPFDAFFVNKILEGMRRADTEMAASGNLRPDQILSYDIETDGPLLRRIIIRNYRERSRLKDILNAIGWTIYTMLRNMKAEKSSEKS